MQLNKPYSDEQYAELAIYCNNHNCRIEDHGAFLEAAPNPQPTLTERNENIRQTRQRLYAAQADCLKYDYEEALARGLPTAPELKSVWLSQKDAIRAANPYLSK